MKKSQLELYIGKPCLLTTGPVIGYSLQGILTYVTDNWVEMETENGNRIVHLVNVHTCTPCKKEEKAFLIQFRTNAYKKRRS